MRHPVPRSAAVLLVATLGLLPASAITDPPEGSLGDRTVRRAATLVESVEAEALEAQDQAFQRFAREVGGEWWGRLVAGTERASLISGSGIAVTPVDGDGLSLDRLETLVRQLIARHPQLLAPAQGELTLSPRRSALREDGRIAFVDFDWRVGGRLVRGARVFARLNSSRIVQLGTKWLHGTVESPEPVLDEQAAMDALFRYVGGRTEVDQLIAEPDLFFLPVRDGDGLVHRLVYRISFRRAGEVPTWTGHVSARDGSVVEFFDANQYGEVTGGVNERTPVDPERVLPLPLVGLSDGTSTDRSGHFLYEGGPISTGLDGRYFSTNCEDGCVNPPQTSVTAEQGLGWLGLGTGGTDEVGNGLSNPAERSSFYQLNLIRLLASKWLSIGWMDGTIQCNVNIADTCNAFYNGTVNFYRSGDGCNNTGQIADVVQHEWGHGLDNNTQGGDSATGEGTADHVAFVFQHDPVIGPYFRTDGSGVRNVDKETNDKGLLTRSNVSEKCGPGGGCTGPLGRECHCEGEIYGQTGWDLANLLIDKYGFHTGWQEYERIFFVSLPQAGSYLPDQPDSIYDAYLAVDDDDGNLGNGTPNGQEIFDAFDLHEIAGDPVGSSPPCARPAEPVVTAAPTCAGVELSWDPVPGAVEYNVMRNPLSADRAFLPRATVTETTFTDGEVFAGQEMHYVVEAVDAAGCRSTIESVVTTSGPERPLLTVVDVETDDTPAGNRSGTVDPGEAVDLFLTLENAATVAGSGLVGQLESQTAGVTIDVGTQGFPDAAPRGTTSNAEGFRFSIDETVACGTELDFTFTVTDATGCAVDTQYFSVATGSDEVRRQDTFTEDNGWIFDEAASSAATGDWTRGEPDPTSYQPGTDSDDAGSICWFTAPNGGGDGTDDVDDGEVVLLSPPFDLSELSNATLSYQRWFANRDTGEDPGDYFIVEASDDDGASWQTVEELGSEQSAPSWTRVRTSLDGLIALTDQVRFRVRVADGVDTGNLIEAAFDDFRVLETLCDDTPPCFDPPLFDGLQSADPGPDCAEATLDWNAAQSQCENAVITYRVYRSTDPDFVPAAANRVAEGLENLSYLDTLLEPDVAYHYVVRPFDSRSGEGSNLVRREATAPTTPDTKPPGFDGLASVVPGADCGEVELDWAAARETCSTPVVYRVYRSTTAGFVPSEANRIAQTPDLALTDAGLDPNRDYHYVVRAVDQAELEEANAVEKTAEATVLAETVSTEDFEAGAAGWERSGLNDATTGLWELGDPDGTDAQPGSCASGTSCWTTGLSASGIGSNDIDDGTTTLLSAGFSMVDFAEPAVRYARYYSNDQGSSPGADTWTVEVSNDDGGSWTVLEETQASDSSLSHVEVQLPIPGSVPPTSTMRVRFVASDLGEGSIVEAEVDDFSTVDLAGGCDDCPPPPTVGTILLSRDGDDIVIDWTGDPVSAGRFKVYTLEGPTFSDATLLGTTTGKQYRHTDGARYGQLWSYRVTAVNACGEEGALE